jgi:AcrR family transcriptional regulator
VSCYGRVAAGRVSEPDDPGVLGLGAERLLRAAWDLAPEQGPGLRLADVAARAGVSRQAVYLHFGDRTRLLLALLAWGDQAFKLGDLLARVTGARTGVEALDRMVEVHAAYSPRIDALAHTLEAHQYQDPAVAGDPQRDRGQAGEAAPAAAVLLLAVSFDGGVGSFGAGAPPVGQPPLRRRVAVLGRVLAATSGAPDRGKVIVVSWPAARPIVRIGRLGRGW